MILTTAPSTDAINAVQGGLGPRGELVVVGLDDGTIDVDPMHLIEAGRSVGGWPSGHAMDSEETLSFSALRGIEPLVETFPLEEANEAYDRMIQNEARFRVVLKP